MPRSESTHPHPRQAVLLAAGEGSRLRPLTDRIPKPMLPIDGVSVIERVLGQLRGVGVTRVVVVVGYLGDVLRAHVDAVAAAGGIDVEFVEQRERRGSAHALQLALDAGLDPTDTIVAASDTAWRDDDVSRFIEAACGDADAIATMALLRWPVAALPHASSVLLDEQRRVQRVLHRVDPAEEPAGATALSGSPLYVFRPALWDYVASITPSTNGMVELASGIQRAIDDGLVVRGHEVRDARDLTRPDDLLRHNFPYLGQWLDEANPSR